MVKYKPLVCSIRIFKKKGSRKETYRPHRNWSSHLYYEPADELKHKNTTQRLERRFERGGCRWYHVEQKAWDSIFWRRRSNWKQFSPIFDLDPRRKGPMKKYCN